MKRTQIGIRNILTLLIAFVMVFSLTACVSTVDYEEMIAQRDKVIEEKAKLQDRYNILEQDHNKLSELLEETEQMRREAAARAVEAEKELSEQQNVYNKLQDTFSREQKANQIKIQMLKSGIKVNLANEILFSSGSAILNKQGSEVLKRAAADLKDSPYQILVAGFTDNVAISGRLAKTFPSNWDLAAARAGSVVRILEEEGVPSDKMILMSFGENHPVDSNDTPDGKSKNRRIEIILRPVPVSLD